MGIESPHNEGLFTDPERLPMAEELLGFVPRQGIEKIGNTPEEFLGLVSPESGIDAVGKSSEEVASAPACMHSIVEQLQTQDLEWWINPDSSVNTRRGTKRQDFPDGSAVEVDILVAERGIELDTGRATVYMQVVAMTGPFSTVQREISYALHEGEGDTYVGRVEVRPEITFLRNFDAAFRPRRGTSWIFVEEMMRETEFLLGDVDPSLDYSIEHIRMKDDYFRELSDKKREIHAATIQANIAREVVVGANELEELGRRVLLLD